MQSNRSINIHKEVEIERTPRVELLESMFDVPITTKLEVHLQGELNDNDKAYSIGLIVGPSGSGKTILLEDIFGVPNRLEWSARSVIDDFSANLSMAEITDVCQSVGFNTIPSWLRPYSVLSGGEKFRVACARELVSNNSDVIRIDEFTSVVDRQVAQFGCHAIQRYVREKGKRLVVASCHYDIIDWLQPDWILEPGNPCKFTWRSLQRRPPITVSISRVKYETWSLFKNFHYMNQDLNKAARCYGLYTESEGLASVGNDTGMGAYGYGNSSTRQCNTETRIPTGDILCERVHDRRVVYTKGDKETTAISEHACHLSMDSIRQGSLDSDSKRSRDEESTGLVGSDEQNAATSLSGCAGEVDKTGIRRNSLVSRRTNTKRLASFCAILYRPHPRVADIYGVSRVVTLPDYQGLGLACCLVDELGAAYKALGRRLHNYPNHPAFIRSHQRSKNWMQIKESGTHSPRSGKTSTVGGFGGRRCAVFMYIGPACSVEEANRLINPEDV